MQIALAAVLLLVTMGSPDGARAGDPLDPLRGHFLASVQQETAIPGALAEVRRLRAVRANAEPGVLDAYEGALLALRGKHALWPGRKLQHLREGLVLLDGAVEAHPEVAEVRYLRLMTCYFLPRLLGRGWSVEEDFQTLARLLPAARPHYRPDLYAEIARFVLQHARLEPRQRGALLEALGGADG